MPHVTSVPGRDSCEGFSRFGKLTPDYVPYQKRVRTGMDLVLRDAYLKWYDVGREGVDVAMLAGEGRAYLTEASREGRLVLEDGLGFVELHNCTTVAFLIVFTWNNDNELWQSVFIKNLVAEGSFGRVTTETAGHRPMLCVWELAAVWHEREAWNIFLASCRDVSAVAAYIDDRFEGPC